MKQYTRYFILAAVVAAATSVIVVPLATTTAQSPAIAAPAQGSTPQLVAGLPDFTRLVDNVAPGVVSVEARSSGGARRSAQRTPDSMPDGMQDGQEIPEIFRRILGPDFPGFPGAPDGPQGGPRGVSMGTGFIISADGYVLTNHHVVDGADEIKIRLSDRRELTAKLVGSDVQSDVALLKVDGTGLPALRLGDSKVLKPGQWVVAIGSPFGLDHSVTAGIVSAVGRANPYANQRYVPFIQTDVAINRGNSGGPLLDTRGQVVGINSQIFSNSGGYMGVSFAIPIDTAMSAVNQIRKTGRVERGQLGVAVGPVDADTARGFDLPDTRGALVNDMPPDSPAAKAGIQRGDVIRTVNGTAINQWTDLPPIVGAMAPGSRVTLGVLREGRERDVTVTLTALDERTAGGYGQGGVPSQPGAVPRSAVNPLGLVAQDLDAAERRRLGLEPDEGVAIARVQGLAAREAGIRPGDVVLAVGRTSVSSVAALDRELARVKTGDTVMLLLRRDGQTSYVAVTPRTGADDEER